MTRRRNLPAFVLLLLALVCLAGCGSTRLQSIAVTPGTATASSVQFTAKGTFSDGRTTSPLLSFWSPYDPRQAPPPGIPFTVTIDSTGLTTCANGYHGPATVYASAPANPSIPISQIGMTTLTLVVGTAQLTCP